MSGIKWQPPVTWKEPINWQEETHERPAEKYLRERDEREAKK
jgi:hypothetical protein